MNQGTWINGFTTGGVECDLTLLCRQMKEQEDAIGTWS